MLQVTALLVVVSWLLSEPRIRRALPLESVAAFLMTAGLLGVLLVTRKF